MTRRPHSSSEVFRQNAIADLHADITCPLDLNEQEFSAYVSLHRMRLPREWREADLRMLAELARITAKIEALSFQMSQESFDIPATITAYERLLKVRETFRKALALQVIQMEAVVMARQMKAATELVVGLNGNRSTQAPTKTQTIDWDKILAN